MSTWNWVFGVECNFSCHAPVEWRTDTVQHLAKTLITSWGCRSCVNSFLPNSKLVKASLYSTVSLSIGRSRMPSDTQTHEWSNPFYKKAFCILWYIFKSSLDYYLKISICCPQSRETKADTLKATEANRRRGPGTREKVRSIRINLEGNTHAQEINVSQLPV
jgi:hypothetical protein